MSKRKRRKREEKKARIRKALQTHTKPEASEKDSASHYINHFPEEPTFIGVILLLRVSSKDQKGHLKDQEKQLRAVMEERKTPVKKVYKIVNTGTTTDYKKLINAFRYAQRTNLPLVAWSTDRIVRNKEFHPWLNADLLPGREEFEALWKNAGWADLFTVMNPNECPEIVRKNESMRGVKKRPGPKPKKSPGYMKRKKERLLAEVLELNEKRMSPRKIAELLDIGSHTTVIRWIKENV